MPETAKIATGSLPIQLKNIEEFRKIGELNCSSNPDAIAVITLDDFIAYVRRILFFNLNLLL